MQTVMASSIPVVKFWLTVTKVIRVEIWPKAVSLSDSPELTTSDLSRALKELSQEDFAEFRQYYAKIVCRLNDTQQTFQVAIHFHPGHLQPTTLVKIKVLVHKQTNRSQN